MQLNKPAIGRNALFIGVIITYIITKYASKNC